MKTLNSKMYRLIDVKQRILKGNKYQFLVKLFILFSISPFLSSAALRPNSTRQTQSMTNVKDFGAKGDGVSDDYKALLAVANYINSKGSGNVFFPKGVYNIASYHTKDNNISDVIFKNCNGLTITGDHAVISVNGNFIRHADYQNKNMWYSYTNQIVSLSFFQCANLTISGIEINGNVDKMRKDPNLMEYSSNLITILECSNIKITDVNLHHGQTDGLYIGGRTNPSLNALVTNSVFSNNARQGMSITFLYGGQFTNCKFINTGLTGAYGHHAPAAGVDVEPNGDNQIYAKNITFSKCLFENNLGGQFLCSGPKSTTTITLANCIFNAESSVIPYQLILAGKNVLVVDCTIDCGSGNIYPTWNTLPGSLVAIRDCTIKSSGCGILTASKSNIDSVTIDNNFMEYTGNSQLKSYFPYLQTANLNFTNNKIMIPSSLIRPAGPCSLIQNAQRSQGNKFYTDNINIKPKVSYQGTTFVQDN